MFYVDLPCACPHPIPPPAELFHEVSNQYFLSAVLGGEPRVLYNEAGRSSMQIVPRMEMSGGNSIAPNLTLQALHQASLTHAAIGMSPWVAWYYIVHQYGEILRRSNQLKLLDDLTANPIKISDANHVDYLGEANWKQIIHQVFKQLLLRINGLFAWRVTQRFSVLRTAIDLAPIAALVGGPNPYRPYYVATPGEHIAEIHLSGDWVDWNTLYERTHQLALPLNYGLHLGEALLEISKSTWQRQNDDHIDGSRFWESIYQFNPRDGEDPLIRGWFTAFFGHTYDPDGVVTEKNNHWKHHLRHPDKEWGWPASEFPSHVSTVPFILHANAGRDVRRLTLVTGVTSVRLMGATLIPELGLSIVEQDTDK